MIEQILYRLDHLSSGEVYLVVIVVTLLIGYVFAFFADRRPS
jgi:hypothetical protein